MFEMSRSGDWGKFENLLRQMSGKFKSAIDTATGKAGEAIITEIVQRFNEQGPGWAGHKPYTLKRRNERNAPKLRRLSRAELVGRSEKLGIVTREQMANKKHRLTKRQLAGRLARSGNQILVETGTLMNSAKFKKIAWNHGRVGMNRRARGINLALIHEFGSSKANIPARPFFVPGFNKARPQILDIYRKAIERVTG